MQRDTLVYCNPAELPWAPWALSGAAFKLLHADPQSGRFSLMIRLDAGVEAPLHRHVGAVEGCILAGGFYYDDQPDVWFGPGYYLLEREGAVHRPVSPQGAEMFALYHGAVEGLDAAGNVTGRIDCSWHMRAWRLHMAHVGRRLHNGATPA